MKSIRNLAQAVAEYEGKLHQASIGDVREILGILSDLAFKYPFSFLTILYRNGQNRAAKRRK